MTFYTKHEAEELHALRVAAGAELFDKAWTELISDIQSAMKSGEQPDGVRARDLARRWNALVNKFTQGSAEIEHRLYVAADKFREIQKSRDASTPDIVGFIRKASQR